MKADLNSPTWREEGVGRDDRQKPSNFKHAGVLELEPAKVKRTVESPQPASIHHPGVITLRPYLHCDKG